jgi:hypothetical protein
MTDFIDMYVQIAYLSSSTKEGKKKTREVNENASKMNTKMSGVQQLVVLSRNTDDTNVQTGKGNSE